MRFFDVLYLQASFTLGQIEVSWRSGLTQTARLQTEVLTRPRVRRPSCFTLHCVPCCTLLPRGSSIHSSRLCSATIDQNVVGVGAVTQGQVEVVLTYCPSFAIAEQPFEIRVCLKPLNFHPCVHLLECRVFMHWHCLVSVPRVVCSYKFAIYCSAAFSCDCTGARSEWGLCCHSTRHRRFVALCYESNR